MARTELTALAVNPAGTDITTNLTAAIADGHLFTNHGNEQIVAVNAGGSDRTLTVQTPRQTDDGLDIEERTVTITAGSHIIIGPFDPKVYSRGRTLTDTGSIYIDYDATTSLSVAILRPEAY